MTPIFDRKLYLERLKQSQSPNILTSTIAGELADRLGFINRTFETALIIASDSPAFAEAVSNSGKAKQFEARAPSNDDHLGLSPQSADAILSILDLHAANDVPGQLSQIARALRPDGLFLACLFAGETLTELRQSWLAAESGLTGGVSPRVAPMIGMRDLGSLLQRANLALPVADLDRTTVRYADPLSLMREIKNLGLANCLLGRSSKLVSRRLLGAAIDYYQRHFTDADGRIRATVEIAWLTAWSPHESQQQPLKPGSAKIRLADALKVPEVKLKRD